MYLTGFHAIEERIKSGKECGPLLHAKPGPRAKKIVELAAGHGIKTERTGTHELDRISSTHRGIALEVPALDSADKLSLENFITRLQEDGKKKALVVVLDEITDPYNFGAILRTCDQFGVDLVITRGKRAVHSSDVVARSSSGAVNWIDVLETPNLPRALEQLKEAGFWVYGAHLKGQNIKKTEFAKRSVLVFGSEGKGISRLLEENCDVLVTIPSQGHVDSLNVSVAAGVFLFCAGGGQAISNSN